MDREARGSAPQPFFEGWAREHAWSERARAHDTHIDHIRRQGMKEAMEDEAAKLARQVARVRGRFHELRAITCEKAIDYLEEDDFATQLKPADLVQILKLHRETVHKLAGSETDTPGGNATLHRSEDEQRELEAILDEIDTEEGSNEGEENVEDSEDDAD